MSWQSLIKPPGKDPKNINEWLALITEKIRELKQTENWYDVSRVITTSSIVDSLDSHRSDAILSANQGRTLKELIDEIEAKIVELSKNSHIDIAKLKESLDENIPKIASNIQSITDLINRLNRLSNDVTGNRQNIESINTSLTEITSKISNLESSLNVLSDRIIKNNDAITKKVEGLETKVDQNLVKVNNEIAGITSDIGQIVGGNEILSGLNVTISSENVITTTEGKVIINGDVISINKSLSINVTAELLNRDYILMLTLKIDTQKQPILSLVENISADEVLISKLSIIDGKIVNNSKMEVLQPINTMVGLAAENEADTIRETIPSGFTRLGELDYEYMINHENEVKIKSESVAYVNGYKVVIPKDTVINIGKAPEKESREDLLFLEAWKDEDFLKTGKVKWRIRHEINVDFDSNYDGLSWSSWYYKSLTFAQGGNSSPVCKSNEVHRVGNEHAHFKNSKGINEIETSIINFMLTNFNDPGLFVAGDGTEYYKNLLKTIDGFSYAIPMFRLYRKPSCGKSIPFEYSKINPKVDYSKFAKLMKEEKVERVVSENITGRSLVNKSMYGNYSGGDSRIVEGDTIKANTIYTLIFNVKNKTSEVRHLSAEVQNVWVYFMTPVILNPYEEKKIKKISVTLSNSQITNKLLWIVKNSSSTNVNFSDIEITNLILLEGDWSNKEIPEYFEGLKSLGEDDGNLITIKNGILDDDTYDVNDGKQKLTTFSQVTHVLSENTIIPKVEADLKRGEHKLSTLTEFKKLDTIGDEKVEFTKIKGRTIQNCYPSITRDSFSSNFSGTIEDGCVVLQGSGTEYKNAFIHISKCLIKPNTNYTMVVDVIYNTLVHDLVIASALNVDDAFNETNETFTKVGSGKIGTYKYLVKSARDITNEMNGLRSYLSKTETGKIKFKIMLLEGDLRTTPLNELSFVNGIKSLGEDENNIINLSTLGKNLFNPIKCTDGVALSQQEDLYNDSGLFASEPIEVIPENKITLTKVKWGWLLDSNMRKIGSNFGDANSIQKTLSLPSNCHYIRVSTSIAEKEQVQIEYGESATNYHQYKKYNQNIHLKEPLRSLPNGIYDEIEGNKIIRRVGKFDLNGSETWVYQPQNSNRTNTLLFTCNPPRPPKTSYHGFSNVLCNRFCCLEVWTIDSPGVYTDQTILGVSINKSELSNKLSVEGFKAWLSQNPTTVYYELATPIEEYLENVYDKESIKTYQLDAPLRSLPNGVRDEIKDGVLIRRCGEVILDGSEDEEWQIQYDKDGGHGYALNLKHRAKEYQNQSLFITGLKLIPANQYSVWEKDTNTIYLDTQIHIYIDGATIENFKTLISKNPVKLVYELANYLEISLTEVTPQSSNFSLQRQFAEGNWLRELPNGVKDTIENGKVIRRTSKIILTGNEVGWSFHSDNIKDGGTLYRYYLPMESIAHIGYKQNNLLCNKLKVVHDRPGEMWACENIHYRIDYKQAGIYIVKDKITTLDSFKLWLKSNPVTIITMAASSTVEELSSNNFMHYPYHDINTCCGSMYIGDGRNYILNDNKMMTENPVIIENEFRKINDKSRITNCHYSKCDEGYDTFFIGNNTKNLISKTMYTNLWFMPTDPHVDHYDTTEKHYSIYNIRINPDKYYFLSSDKNLNRYNGRWMDINKKFISYFKLSGSTATYRTSALPKSPHNAHYLCLYIDSEGKLTTDDYNIQLEEGVSGTEYMDYIPISKYFENTESNDIDDLRHQVSLTGFNYSEILEKSFDSLLRGEL